MKIKTIKLSSGGSGSISAKLRTHENFLLHSMYTHYQDLNNTCYTCIHAHKSSSDIAIYNEMDTQGMQVLVMIIYMVTLQGINSPLEKSRV